MISQPLLWHIASHWSREEKYEKGLKLDRKGGGWIGFEECLLGLEELAVAYEAEGADLVMMHV